MSTFSFVCFPHLVPGKEGYTAIHWELFTKRKCVMQSMQFYPSVFILKLSWKLTSPFFTLTGNNSEVNRLMFAFSQNTRIDEGILNIFQLCLQKQNGISLLWGVGGKHHVLRCALSLLTLDSKGS